MIITLIGYRGTGKSSVARPLAERLGWSAIDADEMIEQAAQASIREIFESQGEPGFRRWERQVMHQLLKGNQSIIAAGGGAVLDADIRAAMRAAGPVIWLTASVETLAKRIESDESTSARRPNLTSSGGREEIEKVLQQRDPLYRECADVVIDTEGRDVPDIAEEIAHAVGPWLREGAAG